MAELRSQRRILCHREARPRRFVPVRERRVKRLRRQTATSPRRPPAMA